MQLDEFINQALTQIVRGINSANEQLKGTNATICPADIVAYSQDSQVLGQVQRPNQRNPIVHLIQFDVSLTIGEVSGQSGQIRVGGWFGGEGGGKSEQSKSYESRIKFGIPMVFPSTQARGVTFPPDAVPEVINRGINAS